MADNLTIFITVLGLVSKLGDKMCNTTKKSKCWDGTSFFPGCTKSLVPFGENQTTSNKKGNWKKPQEILD